MTITNDTLFRRSFRLTFDDKEFSSLNVQRPLTFSFSVQRDKTLTPNNANVLVYNLSADTRAHLEQLSGGFGQGTGKSPNSKIHSDKPRTTAKKPTTGVAVASQEFGVTVRLETGYGDHVGCIFFGVLRKVSSWRQGADWLTQISGGDAEQSITTARISQTFPKGTPLASVVRALVKSIPGIGDGNLSNVLGTLQSSGFLGGGTKLTKAHTFHGSSANALQQIMVSTGLEWHISDGVFYAGPAGTPTVPGEGPLLTPETGLVDEPQIDRNGAVIGKALLNPDLLPGRVFRIESSRVTGNFLCSKTQHKGDSAGLAWYVEFVGTPPAKDSKAATL